MPARLAPWLLAVLGVALALLGSGCRHPLVGLRDVVTRFEVVSSTLTEADLRDRVAERLAAAELAGDVDTSKLPELSVRVDAEFAGEVTRLLTWRGGVSVAVIDEATTKSLERLRGAERDTVIAELGREPALKGHLHAVMPWPGGRAEAFSVAWPPAAEIDSTQAVADGPRVVMPLGPKSDAALETLARELPSARLAILRGSTVVAVVNAAGAATNHRLTVPFGASITAYTEAADVARILATPPLPALRALTGAPAPADWALAAKNLALPLAMSFAWLFFVRRFDRAQPEPLWLVVATFALGAVAVVPAGLLEWGWNNLSPWTNPTYLTFGHSPRAFPLALVGFIVTVGVSEEGAKLFATWALATKRREFDEPVDGIVYGAAAALGFAAAENVKYLALGRVDGPLVASRAFMSVPAHLFFGTIWGYALGRRLVDPKARIWPLFLAAAALHGLFDALLATDGAGVWALAVGVGVASLFLVHLRLALRHGPIASPTPARLERGRVELFRMGSRRVFAAFVVSVYVFSGVVFVLALLGHAGRSGTAFGACSAIALGFLGWAARGVAATLPLDVVVDDIGVTFAGAAMTYDEVERVERRRVARSPRRQEQVVVVGASRRLILGPASGERIDALAKALAQRLSEQSRERLEAP